MGTLAFSNPQTSSVLATRKGQDGRGRHGKGGEYILSERGLKLRRYSSQVTVSVVYVKGDSPRENALETKGFRGTTKSEYQAVSLV